MNGAPRLDTGLFFLNDRFAPSDPAAGFDERADESMKIRVRDLEGGTEKATASANPRNKAGERKFSRRPVSIANGWVAAPPATTSLDTHAFELRKHPTSFRDWYTLPPAGVEAMNNPQMPYYNEVRAIVAEAIPNVDRVLVFDHNVRNAGRLASGTPDRGSIQGYAGTVHGDYTHASGPVRANQLLTAAGVSDPAERAALLARRFLVVNVWRPIAEVQSMPLAVCDGSTVQPSDLVPFDIFQPLADGSERRGQIYQGKHSSAQRWYYYPTMQPEDVLLLKTFDSAQDGRPWWALHTAFKDPTSPPDARPRESIEARCLVLLKEPQPRGSAKL